MDSKLLKKVESKLKLSKVKEVVSLYKEGNTIPFMARYRKEVTGNKDEIEIKNIIDTYEKEVELENRKISILGILKDKEKLTDELIKEINKIENLRELEELYKPFKEKKSRKIEKAHEIGLYDEVKEEMGNGNKNIEKLIERVTKINNIEKEEVNDLVKEVIKEEIVSNVKVRKKIKEMYEKKSFIVTKLKDKEKDVKGKYENYYEYKEEVSKIKGHRLLAIEKAEQEGVIKVKYEIESNGVIEEISKVQFNKLQENDLVKEAVKESYSKRLKSSVENEIRGDLKDSSDKEAIKIFEKNLERLLMGSPLKGKKILALDPAYRTGCKLAVIDETGKLLDIEVIYPHEPRNKWDESKVKIEELINKHDVDVVGVGNGTASRESEKLIIEVIDSLRKGKNKKEISYEIINESGASVYSASEEARREFGNLQVEERSAISLGRRLIDPLSELVKIDPKSIGVGQYQHIVNEKELGLALEFVVERVVNKIGVDINTASVSLLKYVSGLNKTLAENIVKYREENGEFKERKELLKVPKLGKKTYEQSIGFLRIYGGKSKLDETGIHPEDYKEAKALMKKYNLKEEDIGSGKEINTDDNEDNKNKEILFEIVLESRDIREIDKVKNFQSKLKTIEELKVGSKIVGEVRSVVSFGAFVDVGIKNDGFIHISKLANKFISNPLDVINVGDIKEFTILEIDLEKGKVSLSLK